MWSPYRVLSDSVEFMQYSCVISYPILHTKYVRWDESVSYICCFSHCQWPSTDTFVIKIVASFHFLYLGRTLGVKDVQYFRGIQSSLIDNSMGKTSPSPATQATQQRRLSTKMKPKLKVEILLSDILHQSPPRLKVLMFPPPSLEEFLFWSN